MERRVPLIPITSRFPHELGIDVVVQPSDTRVFRRTSIASAGATIAEIFQSARGVRGEGDPATVLSRRAGRTFFFSHTIKGQPHKHADVQRLMELGCKPHRLRTGGRRSHRRLVFFGRWHARRVSRDGETLAAYGKGLARRGCESFNAAQNSRSSTRRSTERRRSRKSSAMDPADGLPEEDRPHDRRRHGVRQRFEGRAGDARHPSRQGDRPRAK